MSAPAPCSCVYVMGKGRIGPRFGGCPVHDELPVRVPQSQDDGTRYVFPTWRAALIDAWEGVPSAYARRRRTIQAAYEAGLTFRAIAEAVGSSPATVHKIIGRQRGDDQAAILDQPAGFVPPSQAVECDGSGGFGPPKDSDLLGWSACPGCARCQPGATPMPSTGPQE